MSKYLSGLKRHLAARSARKTNDPAPNNLSAGVMTIKWDTIPLWLLGFALIGSGCDRQLTESDLVGRYLCAYPYGVEILILEPQGEYRQIVDVDAVNGALLHSGKWRYDKESNDVFLVDALMVGDYFGGFNPDFDKPASGYVGRHVERGFFDIELKINPDFDYVCRRL